MIHRYSRKSCGLILISLAVLFLQCGNFVTPIKEIKNNPEKFENKIVFVSGKVISSQKLSPKEKEGSYIVDDGTGQIKVITTSSIPEVGKKTLVKGKVSSNFVLFGKHFGVVIRED